MGCYFLLQGIFPTQGSNPSLLHCRWILYYWATREALVCLLNLLLVCLLNLLMSSQGMVLGGSLALPPAGPQGKCELTLSLVLLPGFSGKPSLAHTRPVLCLHWLFQTGVKALISEGFLVRLTAAFVQKKKKKKKSRDLRKWMNGMFYVPVLKTILQMQKVIRIWLQFHIPSGLGCQGEWYRCETNEIGRWGGVGRRASDSGQGERSKDKHGKKQGTWAELENPLRWNQFSVRFSPYCCSLMSKNSENCHTTVQKVLSFSFVNAPCSQNMTTWHACP